MTKECFLRGTRAYSLARRVWWVPRGNSAAKEGTRKKDWKKIMVLMSALQQSHKSGKGVSGPVTIAGRVDGWRGWLERMMDAEGSSSRLGETPWVSRSSGWARAGTKHSQSLTGWRMTGAGYLVPGCSRTRRQGTRYVSS